MPRSIGRPGTVPEVAISVRRAELRDIRDIRNIDALVYRTPWSERLTIQEVRGSNRVHFVAERQHTVVGHGAIAFLANTAHVTTIAVHPNSQRTGVGRGLMAELFAAAEAGHCREVTLEVRETNSVAIAFYKTLGLTRAGIRTGYYADTGEDALIMSTASTVPDS